MRQLSTISDFIKRNDMTQFRRQLCHGFCFVIRFHTAFRHTMCFGYKHIPFLGREGPQGPLHGSLKALGILITGLAALACNFTSGMAEQICLSEESLVVLLHKLFRVIVPSFISVLPSL